MSNYTQMNDNILPALRSKRTRLLVEIKVNFVLQLKIKVIERHRSQGFWCSVCTCCNVMVLLQDYGVLSSPEKHSCLPGDFRALHGSMCWQVLWWCWLPFPAGVSAYPQWQNQIVCWSCVVDWLANSFELNTSENLLYGVLWRGRGDQHTWSNRWACQS